MSNRDYDHLQLLISIALGSAFAVFVGGLAGIGMLYYGGWIGLVVVTCLLILVLS